MKVGTKVRILAQRREIQERTKNGWRTKVEIIPERIGVIEDTTEPYGVYIPDTGSYELVHPSMVEVYD